MRMKIMMVMIFCVLVFSACERDSTSSEKQEPESTTESKSAQPEPSPIEQQKPPEPKTGEVLGTFSTKLMDKKKSRVSNINTAIKTLDNKDVAAGAEFSFNTTVGERTEENGYQKAYIFVGKEKLMGYGGGICQVSSTIYNAAMAAGMEVVERHQHERKVDYVEEGKDATVSYGNQDLVFKNIKSYAITLKVRNENDSITVDILRK